MGHLAVDLCRNSINGWNIGDAMSDINYADIRLLTGIIKKSASSWNVISAMFMLSSAAVILSDCETTKIQGYTLEEENTSISQGKHINSHGKHAFDHVYTVWPVPYIHRKGPKLLIKDQSVLTNTSLPWPRTIQYAWLAMVKIRYSYINHSLETTIKTQVPSTYCFTCSYENLVIHGYRQSVLITQSYNMMVGAL